MNKVVRFTGGLGNQMFCYVIYKALQKEYGLNKVIADISFYSKRNVSFELGNVFPNTLSSLRYDYVGLGKAYEKIKYYLEKICGSNKFSENIIFYEKERFIYDESVLKCKAPLICGYWQSYKYLREVEDVVARDFSFTVNEELFAFEQELKHSDRELVSVHVRRGDYLDFWDKYGGICDELYYNNAITYFCDTINNPIFVFMSDDIEWVKERYNNSTIKKECIYIEPKMFHMYSNWYDMYIMSICNNNVIANSTFSWWGAYLNKNINKTVYAPKKWVNDSDAIEICPKEWIRG